METVRQILFRAVDITDALESAYERYDVRPFCVKHGITKFQSLLVKFANEIEGFAFLEVGKYTLFSSDAENDPYNYLAFVYADVSKEGSCVECTCVAEFKQKGWKLPVDEHLKELAMVLFDIKDTKVFSGEICLDR